MLTRTNSDRDFRAIANRPKAKVLMVLLALLLLTASCGESIQEKQQALANDLGVRIEQYQSPKVFPLGYFVETIKPGTEVNAVHQAIREYGKVLRCEAGGKREIYYYFSSDDQTAIRIEVWYDDAGKLLGIEGEDQNSRTIRTEGCVPGRLGESP